MAKNIEIQINTGSNVYEILYPKVDLTNNQGSILSVNVGGTGESNLVDLTKKLKLSNLDGLEDITQIKKCSIERVGTNTLEDFSFKLDVKFLRIFCMCTYLANASSKGIDYNILYKQTNQKDSHGRIFYAPEQVDTNNVFLCGYQPNPTYNSSQSLFMFYYMIGLNDLKYYYTSIGYNPYNSEISISNTLIDTYGANYIGLANYCFNASWNYGFTFYGI